MRDEILESYSNVPKLMEKVAIFGALSKDELKVVMGSMTLKKFEKGDTIFEQGGSLEYINIIEQGIVKLIHEENGIRTEVRSLEVGDCFGETALLGILPYTVTAIAMTEVFLLQMSKFMFHNLLKVDPKLFSKFLLNITREICRRNLSYEKILQHNFD